MEKPVGRIVHFYPKISVAIVELIDELRKGDKIVIKGKKTNIEQTVESMQIEHKPIEVANAGDTIGLQVIDRVREGDEIFKVIEE